MTALSLFESKEVCSVLRRVDMGGFLVPSHKDLKLDWSVQITWKLKAADKSALFAQAQLFTRTLKLTNLQLLSFLIPLRQVVCFHKKD